jgi:FlaA1/EpsC-like NDP-sugar epimerase
MKKHKFSLTDRLRMTFQAFTDAGTLCRGFGHHFSQLKSNLFGVLPHAGILPQAVLLFDAFLAFLSFFIAIYIQIGNEFLEYSPSYILKNMIVFVLTSLSVFLWMQTHRALWRFFSLEDLIPIIMSVVLSTILYFPLMILLAQQEALPRSLPFLNALIYIIMLCIPRYIYRNMYDRQTVQKKKVLEEQTVPVVLAGSGDATELFIREVMHSPALSYHPVAILSPDVKEKGRRIHSIPILNLTQNWEGFLQELRSLSKRPVQIIITETDLPLEFLKIVSTISQRCSLPMMQMIPQFSVVARQNIEETEKNNINQKGYFNE